MTNPNNKKGGLKETQPPKGGLTTKERMEDFDYRFVGKRDKNGWLDNCRNARGESPTPNVVKRWVVRQFKEIREEEQGRIIKMIEDKQEDVADMFERPDVHYVCLDYVKKRIKEMK